MQQPPGNAGGNQPGQFVHRQVERGPSPVGREPVQQADGSGGVDNKRRLRIFFIGGVGVLLTTVVTISLAFGGSADSAPTDASKADFCDTWINAPEDRGSVEKRHEARQTWVTKMIDVGTPTGIPVSAREGFEIYLEALADVEKRELEDDGWDLDHRLSSAEPQKVDAIFEYGMTCF